MRNPRDDTGDYRMAAAAVALVERIRAGDDLAGAVDGDRLQALLGRLMAFRHGRLQSWLTEGGFDGSSKDLQAVRDAVDLLIRRLVGRQLSGLSTAELVRILRED